MCRRSLLLILTITQICSSIKSITSVHRIFNHGWRPAWKHHSILTLIPACRFWFIIQPTFPSIMSFFKSLCYNTVRKMMKTGLLRVLLHPMGDPIPNSLKNPVALTQHGILAVFFNMFSSSHMSILGEKGSKRN